MHTADKRVDLCQRIKAGHDDMDGLRESSDRVVDHFLVEGREPSRSGTDKGAIGVVEIVQRRQCGRIFSRIDSVFYKDRCCSGAQNLFYK